MACVEAPDRLAFRPYFAGFALFVDGRLRAHYQPLDSRLFPQNAGLFLVTQYQSPGLWHEEIVDGEATAQVRCYAWLDQEARG